MLRELFNLSNCVGTALPPIGYGSIEAQICVDITNIVTFTPLICNVKGKEELGKKLNLPDLVRSSGHRPLLIADTASYVLGIGKDGAIRQPMYLELLKECLDETQDEAVQAVSQAIQSLDAEIIRASCTPWLDKKKDEDPLEKARIAFFYQGEPVTNRQSVKEFWERKYIAQGTLWEKPQKAKGNKTPAVIKPPRNGLCSITGDPKIFVGPTMPVMIKGVPDTQGKGAALMSFNYESAESRQWQNTEHAPMGFDVAVRSHQMLNRLLQESRHSYRQGSSSFVYWGEYDTGLNPLIWDDPESLWEDDSAQVAEMIFVTPDQPKGFNSEACKSERFYLAILTGCDGRIAISRWDELTPQRIAENVTHYVETQKAILGFKARPLWQLAGACFRDPSKAQIDGVVRALVGKALWGDPIPPSIVKQAMERIYLDLFSDKKDIKNYRGRYFARFQILALYLDFMNDKRPLKIAQHLGAIAYLMHRAEMEARQLDDDGKTGVAGSLRALATTPKQVFGRLYQNAILYHLPTKCDDAKRRGKLDRTKYLLTKEFTNLVEMDVSPETDIPNTFSLDESAWFYLGWGMREATFWQSDKQTEESIIEETKED
jgi:hypothetical protein